jgi:transposase
MRYYTRQHKYYCGIDLHSKMMYVCVIDAQGAVLLHRNINSNPKEFREAIAPYRDDVVVAVECMFCWYWLADLCADEGISFVLGHAQYMKVIHGTKAKNDKIDSLKIAMLARSGMFPESYVYPREMRGVRDLMRRRSFFVQRRSELYAHVQMTYQQFNFSPPGTKIVYRKHRDALEKPFKDKATLI